MQASRRILRNSDDVTGAIHLLSLANPLFPILLQRSEIARPGDFNAIPVHGFQAWEVRVQWAAGSLRIGCEGAAENRG